MELNPSTVTVSADYFLRLSYRSQMLAFLDGYFTLDDEYNQARELGHVFVLQQGLVTETQQVPSGSIPPTT